MNLRGASYLRGQVASPTDGGAKPKMAAGGLHQRPLRRMHGLGVVLAGVALAGCVSASHDVQDSSESTPSRSPQGAVAIPTAAHPLDEDHPGAAALLVGELRGDADHGCLWLEPTSVSEGTSDRVSVIWPHGYTATFQPVPQLLDEEGNVVAREGDVVEAGGGTTDSIGSCKVSEDIWSVHTIQVESE